MINDDLLYYNILKYPWTNLEKLSNPFMTTVKFLKGSDTFPPLGPLEESVDDMMFSKTERNEIAYNKTLKMIKTLSSVGDFGGEKPYIQLFGYKGYANPGYGGIGAFDLFEVTSPITLIHTGSDICNITKEGNTIWGSISTVTMNWWSRTEDTINLTLGRYRTKLLRLVSIMDRSLNATLPLPLVF